MVKKKKKKQTGNIVGINPTISVIPLNAKEWNSLIEILKWSDWIKTKLNRTQLWNEYWRHTFKKGHRKVKN